MEMGLPVNTKLLWSFYTELELAEKKRKGGKADYAKPDDSALD